MTMMAMMGVMSTMRSPRSLDDDDPSKIDTPSKIDVKEEANRRLLGKGCKVFYYGKILIIALNKKNADRKYKVYCKSNGLNEKD